MVHIFLIPSANILGSLEDKTSSILLETAFLASIGVIPREIPIEIKSLGFLMSYLSLAKEAIIMGILYFLHNLMFCIILPNIKYLFLAFNMLLKLKAIAILFFLANLHKTWFRPDSL